MTPLAKRILFATDFSDCAGRAQDYALFLAEACGACLDILHVLEFQPGMDPDYPVNHLYLEHLQKETGALLDALVSHAAHRGLTANVHQVTGIPSQWITVMAKEKEVDLIVLGTHGRTGLEHILLGSTAERVVAQAPCPVLTVRLERARLMPDEVQAAIAAPAIRTILVPIDFSDCSLDALEYAAQVAKQFSAAVTILHVLEPVSYSLDFSLTHAGEARAQRERLEARLAEMAASLRRAGLTAGHVLRGGAPVDSLLDWSREQAYDLIVMGTHGRRGISHLVSGSVAEAVLRHAFCPVLTVKSPKFSPGHQRIVQP
jgi:nucleotide-binding universal stress UspA family protein